MSQRSPELEPIHRRGLGAGHIVMGTAVAALIGTGVFVTMKTSEQQAAPEMQQVVQVDARDALMRTMADSYKTPLDSADASVKRLASELGNTAEGFVKGLGEARSTLLPLRPLLESATALPRTAEQLATAWLNKRVMLAGNFERAQLLGALLKSQGQTVEYGLAKESRFGATELLARRVAVRVTTQGQAGPWLYADGEPTVEAYPLDSYAFTALRLGMHAQGSLARGELKFADEALELALTLHPDEPGLLFLSAEVKALGEQEAESKRRFEKAMSLSADAMTFYRMGVFERAAERPFKADQHFKKATELDPNFALPHVSLAELTLERLSVTPKEQHAELQERAAELLAVAARSEPNAAGLRIAQSYLKTLEGKEAEALTLLEEETKLHPQNADGWVVLANVYAASERDADAVKALEAAISAGVESADVYEGLGALFASTGRLAEGRAAIERALELNPEDPGFRVHLAQFALQERKVSEARELLNAQIAKFPTDETSLVLLAQLELEQEKPDAALAITERVLANNPHHAESLVFRYLVGASKQQPNDQYREQAVQAMGGQRKLAELCLQNGLMAEAELLLWLSLKLEADDLMSPVLLVALLTADNRADEAAKLRAETLNRVEPSARAELETLFDEATGQALKARHGSPE